MVSFVLAGADVFADHQGALWWPAEKLLVFADLHFEKGSSFAARTTQLLPPYDTHATLKLMQDVVDRHSPRRIVCLGDNFHDEDGPARLDAKARETIQSLMKGRRFVWIEGNHDAAAAGVLGGESAPTLSVGPLTFVHEPSEGIDPMGEVAGHLHPVVTIQTRVKRMRRKCFVSDGVRCVLPSAGAFTGGLDVTDDAFAPLFDSDFSAYALGKEKVYPFPSASIGAPQGRLGRLGRAAPGVRLKLR